MITRVASSGTRSDCEDTTEQWAERTCAADIETYAVLGVYESCVNERERARKRQGQTYIPKSQCLQHCEDTL